MGFRNVHFCNRKFDHKRSMTHDHETATCKRYSNISFQLWKQIASTNCVAHTPAWSGIRRRMRRCRWCEAASSHTDSRHGDTIIHYDNDVCSRFPNDPVIYRTTSIIDHLSLLPTVSRSRCERPVLRE